MTRAPISDAEYRSRVARLQTGMAAADIGALLLTGPADIFYVTGFLTRFWESPTRPWFVVVPAAGEPVAVIPSIGVPLMGRSWLNEIRSWDAPDQEDDGVTLLAEVLIEHVRPTGQIGIAMGHETHLRMPLTDFARVRAQLGPRHLEDATDVIRRAREVKSEAEIAQIRATCTIADRAFARVPEIAREGVPLDRVFREFQKLLLDEGADWVAYLAGGAGAGGYGDVISPASTEPLRAGDVLMLDTGAVRQGYYCDFDRNWAIGPPGDDARRAHALLWQATEAGLAAAKPGARAADLHRAMADVLGTACLPGRLGHGLGITLTEWPSLIPTDTTLLREGMVLTLEPGCTVGETDAIMVHEENFVIRESGAELLSARAPAELPVL